MDWTWLLVGGGALLLLGLGVALVRTMRAPTDRDTATYLNERIPPTGTQTSTRTPPTATTPAPAAAASGASSGASAIDALLAESAPEVVEGKTIKIHRPTNQTLKVLPGRFVVTGGLDDLPEVRFFMPRGRTTTEISFGRSEGRPYEHVQLKPRTVSSRQATLVYDGGKYSLINHAPKDSNPTSVNGRDLGEGESTILQDDDKITMGEVEFVYKAA